MLGGEVVERQQRIAVLSQAINGLGGLPVSLAVAIEVSFSLLNYPPPRHAPVDRQFDFVIFTAGIGGSISTQPHLAVPTGGPLLLF